MVVVVYYRVMAVIKYARARNQEEWKAAVNSSLISRGNK